MCASTAFSEQMHKHIYLKRVSFNFQPFLIVLHKNPALQSEPLGLKQLKVSLFWANPVCCMVESLKLLN